MIKTDFKIICVFLLLLIIISGVAVHTMLLSKGHGSENYFIFREISMVFMTLALAIYCFIHCIKERKNFWIYLLFGNIFAIVMTLHILKLFFRGPMTFGGILC